MNGRGEPVDLGEQFDDWWIGDVFLPFTKQNRYQISINRSLNETFDVNI